MKRLSWLFVVILGLLLLPATSTPTLHAQDGDKNATEQQNAALVRHEFDEIFVKKNVTLIGDLYGEDTMWCAAHSPYCGPLGNAFRKQWVNNLFTAFPDYEATIEQVVASDDTVIIELTGRGTFSNEFQEPMTGKMLAPTNKKEGWSMLVINTLKGGKLTQERWYWYFDRWPVVPPA